MSVSNQFLSPGEDIEDLKQAKEQLQEANREITAILESITDGFVHLDTLWRFTYVNRLMATLTGREPEELLGQSLWEILPEFRGSYLENRLYEALMTQRTIHFEAQQPWYGRWFEVHIYPAQDGLSVYFHDMTARKKTEEALRQSRDAFRLLIEAMPQLVWITDASGCWEYANQQWYAYTDRGTPEGLAEDWISSVHPDDHLKGQTLWQTSLLTSRPLQVEARLRQGKTGVYRWFLVRAVPITLASGQIWKWVGTCTDIHEKKSIEEALRESEVRFRRLVDSNLIGIMIADLSGTIQEANDAFLNLVGYSREEVTRGQVRWATITPPEYRAREAQALSELHTTRMFQPFEKEYVAKDGRHVPVLVGGTIFRKTGDKPRALCFVVDLTAQKAAEEERQAADRRIGMILASITNVVAHLDAQWRYTYVNARGEEYAGQSREALVGKSFWEINPQALGTPMEHQLREAMATQQVRHFEAWHPRWQRWLEVHAYPAQGGLSLYSQDITERKQVEEALRESEARFHALIESNLIGITVSDLTGAIQEANDAFLNLVSYSREDLAAGRLHYAAMTPPEYQEQHQQIVKELLPTGDVRLFEKEYLTKDGRRVPVLVGRTLFRRAPATSLAITFIVDQTVQKEIERQKDLFLGMTGHELKTPLAALRGTLQLIQRRMKRVTSPGDALSPELRAFFESLTKSVADSVRQIDVQTRLINDLLDVSRITAKTFNLDRVRCDLNGIIRQTVEDLRVTAPDRELLLDIPEQTPVCVLADQDRISQVVTNYVTNALRYTPADQPVQIGLTLQEDMARVWVRDRGPGLSKEAQKEIWQRFHQVKGVPVQSDSEKGLGLGLYICQMLIARHQGEVGVESTLGEGSTFWFTLPMIPDADSARRDPSFVE